MFFTFNLFLDFDVEDGVTAGDLGVSVQLDASGTQQLGTVETLGRRLAMFVVDHLTDITERILGRALTTDHLHLQPIIISAASFDILGIDESKPIID